MNSGICSLCGQSKPLVKAHIIPRSFFLQAKGTSKQLLEARKGDVKDVEYWQNGVWDDQILCQDCESKFKLWDDYGLAVLGRRPGMDAFPQNEAEVQTFILKNIDYPRLKLFVLSVLWRASVSSQPFFANIQLGKHESTVADMIRNGNPGSFAEFPVLLARLVDHGLPNATFAPYCQRTPEGINFSLLFLPSIKIMIKVDGRPVPQRLEPFLLKPQLENILLPMRLHANDVATVGRAAGSFLKWQIARRQVS